MGLIKPETRAKIKAWYLRVRPYGVYLNVLDMISENVVSRTVSCFIFFVVIQLALQMQFSRLVNPDHFYTKTQYIYVDPDGDRYPLIIEVDKTPEISITIGEQAVHTFSNSSAYDQTALAAHAKLLEKGSPVTLIPSTYYQEQTGIEGTLQFELPIVNGRPSLEHYDQRRGHKANIIDGDGMWAQSMRVLEQVRIGDIKERAMIHRLERRATRAPIPASRVPLNGTLGCNTERTVNCLVVKAGFPTRLGFREALLALAAFSIPFFVANNRIRPGGKWWQSVLALGFCVVYQIALWSGWNGPISLRAGREFEAAMLFTIYFGVVVMSAIFLYYLGCSLMHRPPWEPPLVTRQAKYRDLVKRLLLSRRRSPDGNTPTVTEQRRLLAKEAKNKFKKGWHLFLHYLWTGGSKTIRVWKLSKGQLEKLGLLGVNRHKKYESKNDFFYPQRLLFAMIFSMWVAFFAAAAFIRFIIPLTYYVLDGLYLSSTTDSSLDGILRYYVPIGLYCSAMFAYITVLGILFTIMRNYRRQIMLLRQGRYFFERENYGVTEVSRYIGYQASHIGITYIVVVVAFVLVITFFVLIGVLPDFRNTIWEAVKQLGLTLLVSVLLGAYLQRMVVAIIFTKYNGTLIRHRNVYSVVDYGLVFYNVVQGLFVAFGRFVYAIGCIFVLMSRCDLSIFPRTLEKYDPAYKAYIAMLLCDHRYNHPVLTVFGEVLHEHAQKLAEERKGVELDAIRLSVEASAGKVQRKTIAGPHELEAGTDDKMSPSTRKTVPARFSDGDMNGNHNTNRSLHARSQEDNASNRPVSSDGSVASSSSQIADDGGDAIPLADNEVHDNRASTSSSDFGDASEFFGTIEQRKRRARTRWFLLYTLHCNPQLKAYRWHTVEKIAELEANVDYHDV